MGLLKVSSSYGKRLSRWLEEEKASGRRDRYYDLVIADHVEETSPVLVPADEGFWCEIDTVEDLRAASAALQGLK
jgi:hypothetical protein